MIKKTWQQIKAIIAVETDFAWFDDDNSYTISTLYGPDISFCVIIKSQTTGSDSLDFENNYKSITPRASVSSRFYQQVDPYTVVTQDLSVPSGKTLKITGMGGDASPAEEGVDASIIWDPAGVNQIVMFIRSGVNHDANDSFVGGSGKVIRIQLSNQTSVAKTLGAYFLGLL